MPGRASKVKGGKQKVERKEKKEKIPPVVVPITVNTPDGRQVELKGISTDVLLDVRHYLIQHVDTTHLTNYSFSHEVRGDKLPDTLEISALRPCVLVMVKEDYSEKQATAHVRRLLDIVACTNAFGPSKQQKQTSSVEEPKPVVEANGVNGGVKYGVNGATGNGVSGPVSGQFSGGIQNGLKDGVENRVENGVISGVNGGVKNGVKDGVAIGVKNEASGSETAVEAAVRESQTSEQQVSSADAEKTGGGTAVQSDPPAAVAASNGHAVPKGLGFGLGTRKKTENPVSDGEASSANGESNHAVKDPGNGLAKAGGKGKLKGKGDAMKAMADVEAAAKRGDREGMYPISRLGTFYEFLSMAHLQAPIQSIKRSAKQPAGDACNDGEYFSIDVRLCNGKLVTVAASRAGFYPVGKPSAVEHELLDVLRKQSGAFTQAYDDLIQGFLDRNQFGNVPTGFRANTFVVPPPFALNPSDPPDLPVEDAQWGGDGGGGGLAVSDRGRPWKALFKKLQGVACGTPEERLVRDRKAFLLHNLFVDVAVRTAIDVVREMNGPSEINGLYENGFATIHSTERDNLKIVIRKEAPVAGGKRGVSNSGPFVLIPHVDDDVSNDVINVLRPLDEFATGDRVSKPVLDRKNVLKGLVADESTALADLPTLGMVTVYYRGLTVTVHALGEPVPEDEMEAGSEVEQLDGGENALNVNSLRLLLHRANEPTDGEDLEAEADTLVEGVLETGHRELETGVRGEDPVLRWELGACWIQHLQDEKKKLEEERKKAAEEREARVASGEAADVAPLEMVHMGERKGFKVEARPVRKGEESDGTGNGNGDEYGTVTQPETEAEREEREKNEAALKALLNPVAWKKVVDSKTGLHGKSVDDLLAGAKTFRDDVALPKLIADFASLELSPVDGRTLTDFMHTRGLNMTQLGDLAKKAEDLPHIKEICVMEMETRAFKRILKAVVAACPRFSHLASALAATLSAFLGEGPRAADTWQFVEKFVELHYGYTLPAGARARLRKLEVLRGLCHKVGIEIAPRNYDLASPRVFRAADIISMIPVYKSVACTTADGRQLLEQSKLALDKGKLDESVQSGCKALSKIIAVCGPCHRMTAGAYSLLAVVLYHTGDFNQATIYQQKALDINERELGLDHPDTMKSFGDLAVFYYRLQHTELALKYVHRALYLLNLICGSEHPNTAATYINVAMMEEGMGNVPIALRYLHEALKCNERLLGADHIQTAAAYHALAIVLSLMEAYSLSVQHEETTFRILTDKLGPDDLKTQDAAAWLDYFDSKALEQQEVARTGGRKPDATIASKGHLSVDDLLNFINKEADQKEGAHKRAKRPPQPIYQRFRASVSSKPVPVTETLITEHPETASESESDEAGSSQEEMTSEEEAEIVADVAASEPLIAAAPAEVDDGNWQEATPRSKAQKLANSSNPPPYNRAFSPRGNFAATRGSFSGRGGSVRDVINRYPRPNPRSNSENGLRLQGVRPGYKPGPKNSHSPRSVLPRPALRLAKPVGVPEQPKAGPQSPVDSTGDGLLGKPEGPVNSPVVAAALGESSTVVPRGPLEKVVETGSSVAEIQGPQPVRSWSFKDVVMAKPRKITPGLAPPTGSLSPNPVVVNANQDVKPEEQSVAPTAVKASSEAVVAANTAVKEGSAAETGSLDYHKSEVAAPETDTGTTRTDRDENGTRTPPPVSEPSPSASDQSATASDRSVTTSERSDSPALSESSSQRSVPLTPFCKKADTPPLLPTTVQIPIPLPGPAVVPVTPVRRFSSPVPAQPAFQQGPQIGFPPLLPTPPFRVHYPIPSNNNHYQSQQPTNNHYQNHYHNVNGLHMPVPIPVPMQGPPSPHYGHPVYPPPPQTYPQFAPPVQWSPRPAFRPNPLAVEFKPSGSPPLQNPNHNPNPGSPSLALNPAAAAFVPGSVKKVNPVEKDNPVETAEVSGNPEVTETQEEAVVGNCDGSDGDDAVSEERKEALETGETAPEVEEEAAGPSEQNAKEPGGVTTHQHVDDVSAAVLHDAKAAAEAAIKAALAKGGSNGFGSFGGLKLSADATPFQPSSLISRTKSCGSLSQDGERDMVSVSVR